MRRPSHPNLFLLGKLVHAVALFFLSRGQGRGRAGQGRPGHRTKSQKHRARGQDRAGQGGQGRAQGKGRAGPDVGATVPMAVGLGLGV